MMTQEKVEWLTVEEASVRPQVSARHSAGRSRAERSAIGRSEQDKAAPR